MVRYYDHRCSIICSDVEGRDKTFVLKQEIMEGGGVHLVYLN